MTSPAVAALPRLRPSLLSVGISICHVFLISSAPLAGKVALRDCPPFTLLAIRSFAGALVVWLLTRWLGMRWPAEWRAWPRLMLFGLLQTLFPILFNFMAVRHASAGMVSIVAATNPMFVTLLAPRLLGEHLSLRRAAGVALGFGGVVFVMLARLGTFGREDTPLGILFASGIALSHVTSTTLYKRIPPKEPILVAQGAQLLVAGTIMVPLMLWLEPSQHVNVTVSFALALTYIILFLSIGSMLIWCFLLQRGEASVTSSFLFLLPVFGILLATVFLHERFTLRDGFGLTAIVAGILLIRK